MSLVTQTDQTGAFHLTDDGIQFHTILETETFQVIIILFGIEENRRPNLIGLELFKNDISFVIMIIQIKIGRMVSTILIYNQNPVLSLEFSQVFSPAIGIQTQHIFIQPDFTPAQSRYSFLHDTDLVDIVLCQCIPLRITPFDRQRSKIIFEYQFLYTGFRFQANFNHFSLPVGIGRKMQNPGSGGTFSQVIHFIPGHTGNIKTLHIRSPIFTVPVYDIINRTFIVLFENIHILNILTDEYLIGHLRHIIGTVFLKDNHIIHIRALADKLVFLQGRSDKTFFPVDVKLFICDDDLSGFDIFEITDFRFPFPSFPVFRFYPFIISDRIRNDVFDIMFHHSNLFIQTPDIMIGFFRAKLQDSFHLDLQQFFHIVIGHLPVEFR